LFVFIFISFFERYGWVSIIWTRIKLWSLPGYRVLKWAGNVIKGKSPFQVA
jgi:hypothetical protein